MKNIEVYPKQLFYYYVPEGEELPYFSWKKGIVISCFREPVTSENEFFAELGLTPDETGVVYSAVGSDMYLVQGEAGIYISVPESLNDYDTIRSLCEMEKIEISDATGMTEDASTAATWEIDAEEKMPLYSLVETLVQSGYFESLTTVYTPPSEIGGFCLRNIELLPHSMICYL